MCQFCVEHGEGERWYLQAKNYAYDLDSDLKRRQYVIDFVDGFGEMRSNAIRWMDRFDRLPAPLSRAGKNLVSARQRINHFGQPVPLEECERILELATSITVIPCVCRLHTPGGQPREVCMLVTTKPVDDVLSEAFASYEDGPDLDDFHHIDKAQAMSMLAECEHEGLMHSIWTFKTPFAAAICNCNVESGCMAMRLTARHGLKVMWRGEWVARIESERCTRCARCVRVCPFGAISAARGTVHLDETACWGCGICRSSCSHDAIALLDRRDVPSVAQLW